RTGSHSPRDSIGELANDDHSPRWGYSRCRHSDYRWVWLCKLESFGSQPESVLNNRGNSNSSELVPIKWHIARRHCSSKPNRNCDLRKLLQAAKWRFDDWLLEKRRKLVDHGD